ncbi:MAG TPA: hypothetical protein VNO17_02085 [Actinomycetota bacterium]|nr:hypothetical protein [Actinomycetota bacterium]
MAINTVVLIAMVRQVGVVLLRVGQIQAPRSREGPRVGDILRIEELPVGFQAGATEERPPRRLLVFLSPDCGLCKELVPAANAVARGYGNRFEIFMIVDGDEARVQEWGADAQSHVAMIAAEDALTRYGIPGAPFACITNREDAVLACAWVNHLDHLEALIRSCPQHLPHEVHADGDTSTGIATATFVARIGGGPDGASHQAV